MTPKEKKKAFDAAVKTGITNRTLIQINTRDEILRLLAEAQIQIVNILASQPSDYQRWSLPNLQMEINRMMKDFGEAGAAIIGTGAGASWLAGQDLTDKALAAANEARIVSIFPRLDITQLNAMRAFMTDRIKDIGVQGANKINSELGLVVIGAQSAGDAITRVRQILGEPSRARAHGIVRTELNRVFNVANQQRQQHAVDAGVPLKKKWVKSGKQHPRIGHNMAHGQTVPVNEPFLIPSSKGGSATKMMFPVDPAAPIGETIHCGCASIPAVDFSQPITPSGFVSGIKSTVPAQGFDKWTIYENAAAFAERKGLSPGKGVPAKSTMTQYAQSVLDKKSIKHLDIGGVEKWVAIKQATGIDVGGYKTVLDASSIKHIHKQHGIGNEKDKRQRGVTAKDIAHIPDILASFDSVSVSKNRLGLSAFKFKKLIAGEEFTYVAEVRTGRKKLAPTSMWIKKKVRGGAMPK